MWMKMKTCSVLLLALAIIPAGSHGVQEILAGETGQVDSSAPAGKQLTLDEAIKVALQNNLSLRAASSAVRSAQWSVKKAYLDYLPRVDFGFQYLRLDKATVDRANIFTDVGRELVRQFAPDEDPNDIRPGAWRNSYGPTVSVVQPIYTGGTLRAQLGLAQAEELRNQANREETYQQVILDTQTAYYQVLKAQELLALAQESYRSSQQHLETARKMLEVGLRSRSEVLRFEVQLASAESQLVVAENDVDLAKSKLNLVMGVDLDNEVNLTPVKDFRWQAPPTLAEQMAVARQRHPGLRVAKSNVSVQQSAVAIARSGFLPKVSLAYNYGWEANDTFAFDSFTTWSFAITASIPVFSSFQNYAELQKEREGLKQARSLEQDFVRSLQLQVKQASLNLQAAEKRITIAEKAVEEASENLRILSKSYSVGLASSLDVIDAQLATTQAKASLIEARYDYFLAKAQLARAMGVLGK